MKDPKIYFTIVDEKNVDGRWEPNDDACDCETVEISMWAYSQITTDKMIDDMSRIYGPKKIVYDRFGRIKRVVCTSTSGRYRTSMVFRFVEAKE